MQMMCEGLPINGGFNVIHITYEQFIANPSAYTDPELLVDIYDYPDVLMTGADVAYDSVLDLSDIGNIATKSLAKVEPSDTALYAHNSGTYFINKDGEWCKATSNISVGQTLTKNTNYTVTDIGSDISRINNDLSDRVPFVKLTTDYYQLDQQMTFSTTKMTAIFNDLKAKVPSGISVGMVQISNGLTFVGNYLIATNGYMSIDVHSYRVGFHYRLINDNGTYSCKTISES